MPSPSSSSSLSAAVDIPDAFLCPITAEIMVCPVMTRAGLSFDRSAILEWLVNHGNTCPLTRQPLNASCLVTNHALRLRIQDWCRQHGHELKSNGNSSYESDATRLVTCLSSAMTEQRQKAKQQKSAVVTVAVPSRQAASTTSGRSRRRQSIFNILQSADVLLSSSR